MRWGPRPRRLSAAVPSAKLLTVEFVLAKNMGSLLRTSSTRVRPVSRTSAADTEMIALGFDVGIDDLVVKKLR